MSDAARAFLELVARPRGKYALDAAATLIGLIVKGAQLGELEPLEVTGVDGETRTIKVPPAIWFERICRAVEVGAFDRLSIDQVVERILLPPDEGTETASG